MQTSIGMYQMTCVIFVLSLSFNPFESHLNLFTTNLQGEKNSEIFAVTEAEECIFVRNALRHEKVLYIKSGDGGDRGDGSWLLFVKCVRFEIFSLK